MVVCHLAFISRVDAMIMCTDMLADLASSVLWQSPRDMDDVNFIVPCWPVMLQLVHGDCTASV